MLLIVYVTLLMLATLTRGNDDSPYKDENPNKNNIEQNIEESFDSPVYGPSSFLRPGLVSGKSAYNVPAPVLPSSYAAYLSNLGYGFPYTYSPYNRYGTLPYSIPSSYGALLNNPAYLSAYMSGLGYAGYGGPYFGRSVYPGYGYGFPGYISGVGYPPASLRRGPAPITSSPASVVGIAASVPRAAPIAVVPPAVSGVPAPISTFPNIMPGVVAPVPGVLPNRALYRSVQSKDGTIRYAPDIQSLY